MRARRPRRHALAAELSAASRDQVGPRDRGGVHAAPCRRRRAEAGGCRPSCASAADGQRDEHLGRRAGDDVEDGVAVLVAGGDVEEGQLVGARGVIDARPARPDRRHRAGDEVDAFHHAAVLHVEAGDHAQLQHLAFCGVARDRLQASAGISAKESQTSDRLRPAPLPAPAPRPGRSARHTARGR